MVKRIGRPSPHQAKGAVRQFRLWSDAETVDIARRLAPHSLRLRIRLAQVEGWVREYLRDGALHKGHHRITDLGFLFAGLERLCNEVMAEIGVTADGEFYETARSDWPDPTDFHGAIKWMADPAYCRTSVYRLAQGLVRRTGVDPALLAWLDAFIDKLRDHRLPFHPTCVGVSHKQHGQDYVTGVVDVPFADCPFCQGYAAEIGHCQYGVTMPDYCWQVVRAIGEAVAEQHNLAFEDADPGRPERWIMLGWRELKQSPRKIVFPATHRWSRSPEGEREALEAFYGLTNERWAGDPYGGAPDWPEELPPDEED